MTSLRKLERDFAYADLAAVSALVEQLGAEDIMTRLSLEARQQELRETVAQLDRAEPETLASAALFFGGKPVVGSQGIESEFGSEALQRFQDLVSKVLAHEAGALGQRGVVPNKNASVLHITNVIRGSFGFLLEEFQPQQALLAIATPLKEAVGKATRLLNAFGELDEEVFRSAVETIDERVLGTAREFFDLMRQNEATLRLVAGEDDRRFSHEAVARAADRATSTAVEDAEEAIPGQLAGVLPDAHQFEFRSAGERGTIRGRIDRTLSADQLTSYNRELVNVDTVARVQVKRVRRNQAVVRESYTLLGISQAKEG